jgi:hypothetical protein
LLADYEPGLPKMKPDVLKQIKEIEAEREIMIQEEMKKMQANSPIMLQRPGQEPIQLSNQDVVNMIQEQQKQIATMTQKCSELENMIVILQKQLVEKTKMVRELSQGKPNNISMVIEETIPQKNSSADSNTIAELENMIAMLQKQLIEKTKTIRELSSASKPSENTSTTASAGLVKQNNELQQMVGSLQKELIKKTMELKEATSQKETMTRIPIEIVEEGEKVVSKPVIRNKSDPEVVVNINSM